jgi:hypothetical protein
MHALSEFQARDPRNRAVSDLGPRGHRDRLLLIVLVHILKVHDINSLLNYIIADPGGCIV